MNNALNILGARILSPSSILFALVKIALRYYVKPGTPGIEGILGRLQYVGYKRDWFRPLGTPGILAGSTAVIQQYINSGLL